LIDLPLRDFSEEDVRGTKEDYTRFLGPPTDKVAVLVEEAIPESISKFVKPH
jgi:hypothetical protein